MKKILIRMLVCLLVLALPMTAMATGTRELLAQAKADGKEVVATITFTPGETLSAIEAVKDLSDCAAIRVTKLPDGYAALALLMSDEEVATLKTHVDKDGLLAQSETLGEQAIYLSWQGLMDLYVKAMEESGVAAEQLEQMKAGMSQMLEQGIATNMAAEPAEELTEDEIYAKVTEAMGGDEGYVNWIKELRAKAVVENGAYTLDNADEADTLTTMTLTQEDLVKLYQIDYIKSMVLKSMKSSNMTDEKAEEEYQKLIDAVAKMEMTMPISIYTKGEKELIAMQTTVDMKVETEVTVTTDAEETETAEDDTASTAPTTETRMETTTVNVTADIAKKTLDNGKQYTGNMGVTVNDEKKMTMNGTLERTTDGANGVLTVNDGEDKELVQIALNWLAEENHDNVKLTMTANDAEQTMAIVLEGDNTVSEAAIDTKLSIAAGTTVEDAVNYGTINVNTVIQDDSGAFDALKGTSMDSAVKPLEMTDEELGAWVKNLQTSAMTTVYKLLGSLPASVANLMMSSTRGN